MTYPGQISFDRPTSTGLLQLDRPDFRFTLDAVYNTEFPLRSAAINKAFGLSQGFFGFQDVPQEMDERFDPMDRMRQDNDLHLFSALHEAKNEDHYSLLKRKAIWEGEERQVIADSSFMASLAAGALVGTTDPLNLAVGVFTGGATTVFGAAFRAVASAAVVTGTNEALLHQTQVARTLEESIGNVVGDMIFSTALGMGGYALSRSYGYSPEKMAEAFVREYEVSGLPFWAGELSAQLGIRPQTKWNDRADIIWETTRRPGVAAYYKHEDHTIHIDPKMVEAQFLRRAWRDPKPLEELDANGQPTGRTTQAEPLADDHFIREGEFSLEAWQTFVVQHEYLHTVHKIAPGESEAKYETRINDYALALRKAGSLEGVHHTPITDGTHGLHADMIHNKFDEMGDDGVRQTTILQQMVEEGAFGHSKDDLSSGYIKEEDIAGPDIVDTDDALKKATEEGSNVDPQTGISDEQYLGSLSWTTKLLRALGGIEKFRASPMLWVMNSKNAATRLFGMRMVPTPMSEGNLFGHTTPGDAATAINARHVELAEAIARGEKTWIDYRLGRETEGKPSAMDVLAESARSQKERLFRESEADKTRYIAEFRTRVSRALRSGDLDEDPMIQKHVLYLRKWIDNMTKEADALGMFGAGIKPGDALSLSGSRSFLPRQWLQDVLLKPEEFDEAVTVIVNWQRANANAKDVPEYMAKLVLDPAKHQKFIKTQLLTVGRKLHSVEDFDIEATDVSGTFKGRGIWVDDLVLSGDNKAFGGRGTSFLENDINEVLKKWVPHMHTDMELTRKFGSVGMESQFATIRRMAVDNAVENKEAVFNKTLKGLDKKAPDKIVKTTKSAEKDIEKLSAMRDIMRGVYSLSGDPLAVSSRFARLLTDATHLSLMGNVTISSIPDAGRILMVNRLEGLKTLGLAFKDFKRLRSEMRGMRDVGIGMDMAMGTTVQALVHNGSIHRFTGLERVVGRLTDINFIVNLLGPWNAIIKQAAGIATASRVIKDLKKYKAGTLSRKHASKLSNAGVSEEFMERLLTLHEKYGDTVDGVEIPNASLWDLNDTSLGFDVGEFLLHFRRVLSREVDMQIVTPGAGDIPLALRKTPFNDAVQESLLGKIVTEEDLLNPGAKKYHAKLEPGEREHARSTVRREAAALYPHLGRVFGIYKSFIAGTWGRVLVPSLQNKDSTEFMGLATMVMLGGMAKTFKDLSYDRPGPESLKGFLLEGFDQAGVGSWFMFANSQGEALLDTGLRPLLGMPRFAPSLRWQASSVLGASVGQLIRAGRLAGDAGSFAMGEDFSSSSATNAYRMLPGQSLFYLRLQNLFKFRNTVDEALGTGNAVGDTG
jgi:hypothetical protein